MKKKKILRNVHNALLFTTILFAYAMYMLAILKLGKWHSWTCVKVMLISMTYLVFIVKINRNKLIFKDWFGDEE